MDDRQGNTFSFQLTTKDTDDLPQVEKISTGRYEQQLTPPVFVPFNATPTVALYDLTFANTMANIDPAYKNDTLVLGFGTNVSFPATNDANQEDVFVPTPYTIDGGTFITEGQVNNEITIKIPKGNYTLSDLEVAIAKELYKTKGLVQRGTAAVLALDAGRDGGKQNDYWQLMDAYAQSIKMFAVAAGDPPTNKPAGVADPNIAAQFSSGTLVVNPTPPLTFDELERRSHIEELGVMTDRYIKPVTFKANAQTNRLEVIIVAGGEFRKGSTLATKVLGFDESQLASSTLAGPHWQPMPASAATPINPAGALSFDRGWDGKTTTEHFNKTLRDKQKPQRLDSSRVINFHLPGLVKGSYNRNGEKGNGRVATVPITVPPGAVEQWQVQTPLYMPCDIAGAYINSIVWFITNEEGKVIDLQGGRMSATVIVRWPAVPEGPVPPSSLAARTDPNIVRMPWAGVV
jgi:hypothetical protein